MRIYNKGVIRGADDPVEFLPVLHLTYWDKRFNRQMLTLSFRFLRLDIFVEFDWG